MQTTRKAVGAALALVKLASRMQPGEHKFDDGSFLFRVQTKRNATAVIFHTDRTVGMQGDTNLAAMTGQCFVSGVVQHLLDDMQGIVGTGVHARALPHRLQALEHTDRRFGIRDIWFDCHGGRL